MLPISLADPADRYDGYVEAIGQVGDYWYARVGHILCGMDDCECGGRDGQSYGDRYYLAGPRRGANDQDAYLVCDRAPEKSA